MIESLLGRVRGEKRYASRLIDIDILLYDDIIVDEESLKIPHPLMHQRRFVLVPLCELAPDYDPSGAEKNICGSSRNMWG